MTIYEHRTTLTVSGGSANTTTLNVRGGPCTNVLIRALTNAGVGTTFRADLRDDHSIVRMNWGYHTGEINDQTIRFPMAGPYTLHITNASATDTFDIIVSVEEPR